MEFNKIVIIYNSRIPTEKANGYQTFKTAEALILNNKKVEIWAPNRFNSKSLLKRDIKDYYNLEKVPRVIKVFAIDLLTPIKFENFLTKYCKLFSSILLMISFSLSTLLRIIFTNKKDTIYFTRDVNIASILMKFFPGLNRKIILELHNLPTIKTRKSRQMHIFNKCRALITLTKTMKDELIKEKINKNKIFYSPDAVDTNQFKTSLSKSEARKFLNLPSKTKIFLYIGKFHTLGKEKGIPEIIESIKFLNLNVKYKFYIIGGPLDRVENYKKIINSKKINSEKIKFFGRQEIKDIPQWTKAADILLMPHPKTIFYQKYVSPLKLFEYMCSNNPIIASDLDSIKEILSHKKNSYLVEPGSSVSIARAIEALINDPLLAKKISEKAFKEVDNFSWEKRALSICEFVKSI